MAMTLILTTSHLDPDLLKQWLSFKKEILWSNFQITSHKN